jgi:hypothetical protein
MDEHFGFKAKGPIGHYLLICNPLNPQPNMNQHGRKP